MAGVPGSSPWQPPALGQSPGHWQWGLMCWLPGPCLLAHSPHRRRWGFLVQRLLVWWCCQPTGTSLGLTLNPLLGPGTPPQPFPAPQTRAHFPRQSHEAHFLSQTFRREVALRCHLQDQSPSVHTAVCSVPGPRGSCPHRVGGIWNFRLVSAPKFPTI